LERKISTVPQQKLGKNRQMRRLHNVALLRRQRNAPSRRRRTLARLPLRKNFGIKKIFRKNQTGIIASKAERI